MIEDKIKEISLRRISASPGPWTINTDHFPVCHTGKSNEDDKEYMVCMNGYLVRDGWDSDAKTDANFIANSWEDVGWLVDKVLDMVTASRMVVLAAIAAEMAMPDQKLVSMATSDLKALRRLGDAIHNLDKVLGAE